MYIGSPDSHNFHTNIRAGHPSMYRNIRQTRNEVFAVGLRVKFPRTTTETCPWIGYNA
jgi:hypothetical protein